MLKRVVNFFMIFLVFLMIWLTILNLAPRVEAGPGAIYGTTTMLVGDDYWIAWFIYGEGLSNRHLYGSYYCVYQESNCAIVF